MNKVKTAFSKLPGILYGLIVIGLIFSVVAQGFFTVSNLLDLAKSSGLLILVSMGMSLCILSGYIDMSVGALMSLSGVVTALCLKAGTGLLVAVLAGIVTGLAVGSINGALIAYEKFDFWVVTYAMMGICQGVALKLSNGNTIAGFKTDFRFIGDGKILGIYFIIWATALLCLVMTLLCNKTKFGYNIYSIGGSYQCASLAGVNVRKNLFFVFVLSGLLASLSGIMLAAKSNSASPIGGQGYEFDAIAAVLIGGTSFEGGKGKITGTIIGAIMMRMIRNGLNLVGFSPYYQTFLMGLIIVAIILIDVVNQHRKKIQATRRVYK